MRSAGTIKVIATVYSKPKMDTLALAGTNLIAAGTGGTPGGTYSVLSSTNVALPVVNWVTNYSGVFGPDGSFSNNLPIFPVELRRFYILKQP